MTYFLSQRTYAAEIHQWNTEKTYFQALDTKEKLGGKELRKTLREMETKDRTLSETRKGSHIWF